ncbi:AarF/UbiB family protein [Pelagicoccus mobilis]|uniref:ABC1 atypical kinase-like domain-containing protein n=1 Tax=Pelagicoccus mobilis TaxID=415221 RepID=A0A934VK79_9BACT|nr:AarF/UbiB family protein [Pelagicoccus mobilis]MBK1876381.1 hypothetical protein [Pelagicoccus mobilis]
MERDANDEELGRIACQLLHVENLLPSCYAQWKPVLSSAFRYFVDHLSPSRLVPRLEKLLTDLDLTPQQRLLIFLSEMPTLQKLGQVVSRNRNLAPELREALIQLENSIRDVDPTYIFKTIRDQLGSKIERYSIQVEELIHSEASVAAVVRFSFIPPESDHRREGVFKVLKPNIGAYFWEEMSIWDGLIQNLDQSKELDLLSSVNLAEIIADIRDHLLPELEFSNEQKNLKEAKSEYANVTGIQIPELSPELCTDTITAMSYEEGVKVTEAFTNRSLERRHLANRLIQVFIAQPLFQKAEKASFLHADPHPGNLIVDEKTGNLKLIDWALVERIAPKDRHQILRIVSALFLRDDELLSNSLQNLSHSQTDQDLKTIREESHNSILQLPFIGYPHLEDVTALIDRLALKGIRFKKQLLVYRKTILTLQGVLCDLDPENTFLPAIGKYVGEKFVQEILHLHIPKMPVTSRDINSLAFSLCWMTPRIQLNLMQRLLSRTPTHQELSGVA